jgi:hypothetical protein
VEHGDYEGLNPDITQTSDWNCFATDFRGETLIKLLARPRCNPHPIGQRRGAPFSSGHFLRVLPPVARPQSGGRALLSAEHGEFKLADIKRTQLVGTAIGFWNDTRHGA